MAVRNVSAYLLSSVSADSLVLVKFVQKLSQMIVSIKMKTLLITISLLASNFLSSQVSEKDLSKLAKYEQELESGDIYKADKKADQLIQKYPDELVVIDFKIRCIISIYKESFEESNSTLVSVTSRVVRKIWFEQIIDLVEKEFLIAGEIQSPCKYVDFLNEMGTEKPYDSGDLRTLSEMHGERLNALNAYCK